jgi:phenylpyruvate tautomerase PptA (4-oxalocrotonate tautomerase family)
MGSSFHVKLYLLCFSIYLSYLFQLNMPFIKVQSSVPTPDRAAAEVLLKSLSSSLAKHTGKPEAYVMTAFEPDVAMTFAGTLDPVCYVEIKSVGTMKPDQTQAMSQDFCQKINAALGVAKDRIYIEFADAKGYMWGWNGSTFG